MCRIMNGVNAPKVVECIGSDGHKYRQLAKSGNDDLRQDAVCIHIPYLLSGNVGGCDCVGNATGF